MKLCFVERRRTDTSSAEAQNASDSAHTIVDTVSLLNKLEDQIIKSETSVDECLGAMRAML